jgi:hypothetical protein
VAKKLRPPARDRSFLLDVSSTYSVNTLKPWQAPCRLLQHQDGGGQPFSNPAHSARSNRDAQRFQDNIKRSSRAPGRNSMTLHQLS